MIENITIDKNTQSLDDLDFDFLRTQGIAYIESLGSSLWTDYNSHDPGITTLEALCYAITDLGSRMALPMETLLAEENNLEYLKEQFLTAEDALPIKPVTAQDYRKLFINLEGIKNAWLRKHEKTVYIDCKEDKLSYQPFEIDPNDQHEFSLNGLYDILIEIDPLDETVFNTAPKVTTEKKRLKKLVRDTYHAHRNLCEDLVNIEEVEEFPVAVCAHIELLPDADEEFVHALILRAIENYLSPSLRFYSLKEMLDKGHTTDEIFNGPLLTYPLRNAINKGFTANQIFTKTFFEDVIKVLIDGGHTIKEIFKGELLTNALKEEFEDGATADEIFKIPILKNQFKNRIEEGYSIEKIIEEPFFINGFLDKSELEASELVKEVRLSDLIQIIQKIEGVDVIRDITINTCDGTTPESQEWNICVTENMKPVLCDKSSFSYFKGYLPLNLNLDEVKEHLDKLETIDDEAASLISSASNELELPSGTYSNIGTYSTVQNDFPEVYGIGQLGVKPRATKAETSKAKQLKAYLLFFDQILASYFAHLKKVNEILSLNGKLRDTYFTQLVDNVKNRGELVSSEYSTDQNLSYVLFKDLDDKVTRRNQTLDHLLARFAENFSDYAFLMKQLYGPYADEAVLKTKEDFLENYKDIGCERPLSFNYWKQEPENLWDTKLVSSFEKRIALLTGNTNYGRRNFSDDPLELYEEIDTDGKIEYRFRFVNDSGIILSSSSKHYHTLAALFAEILDVKNYGRFAENYEIKTNISGKYYFNLTNPLYTDPTDERHVIARKIPAFDTLAEAEEAIEEVVAFMNYLKPNEGMYVIEHILLRPNVLKPSLLPHFMPICTDDCDSCESIDPYSFRVSIVLPGWTERYSNIDFRRFMEDLIQRELPSHILAKICWIGYPKSYDTGDDENEMVILEEAYKEWLLAKTNKGQDQPITKMKKLISIMSSLHTIYHQSRLHNCDSDDAQESVILGRTNLGKL